MTEQTVQLALILLVLVLALLVLPAALFIRLVESILSAGFKAIQRELAILQAPSALLTDKEDNPSLSDPQTTLITQDTLESSSTESTKTTRSPKD